MSPWSPDGKPRGCHRCNGRGRVRDLTYRVATPPFATALCGTCQLCGGAIVNVPRIAQRRWHRLCLAYWWLVTDRNLFIRALNRLHSGPAPCAQCGTPTGFGGEVDHIVPLIDGGQHDLWNLQLLCHGCHVDKTAGEAARRRPARNTGQLQLAIA